MYSQISLTGIGTYTENFNSLVSTGTSSSVPSGWIFLESSTNANLIYSAGTGSNNDGDTYSFGSTGNSDRAFGSIRTGTLIPILGANFTNNTGNTITQIPISYTGEQWRLGANYREAADRLDFQYSLNATSLNNGDWTDVDNLDFTSPITNSSLGALDGNASANRTSISYVLTGLSISNNSSFWIRWLDFDVSGSDDGLAIDDFSIDQTNLPVELTSFSASVNANLVNLKWETKTEVNNYGFEILRSAQKDNDIWTKIGFVEGHGNSNSPKHYKFIDNTVTNGKYFYRLKQIDTDGKFEFSNKIEVDLNSPKTYSLGQNYPNPFNPSTKINYTLPEDSDVQLAVFTIEGELVRSLVSERQAAGFYSYEFNAEDLASGSYIYRLTANNLVQVRKMVILR